jgi:hypothetical protein
MKNKQFTDASFSLKAQTKMRHQLEGSAASLPAEEDQLFDVTANVMPDLANLFAITIPWQFRLGLSS